MISTGAKLCGDTHMECWPRVQKKVESSPLWMANTSAHSVCLELNAVQLPTEGIEKAGLWAAHSWSWAAHLHSPNTLCDWGSGQAEHNLLQEAGLTPCWQVGTPLQFNTLLAKMSPVILPPEICHPVYQRCMLLLQPCFQVPPEFPNQLGQGWGTPIIRTFTLSILLLLFLTSASIITCALTSIAVCHLFIFFQSTEDTNATEIC